MREGQGREERGHTDTAEHSQNGVTSLLPIFSNWWGISISSIFINPQTKCDFLLFSHIQPQTSYLPSRANIFQRLLGRANVDPTRRFRPILYRNVYKWEGSSRGFGVAETGFKSPFFQSESHVTGGVDCFALTTWKDRHLLWQRIIWHLLLTLLKRIIE